MTTKIFEVEYNEQERFLSFSSEEVLSIVKAAVKEASGTDLSHLTAAVPTFGEKFEPMQITSLPSYLSVIWPLLLTLGTCPCQSH